MKTEFQAFLAEIIFALNVVFKFDIGAKNGAKSPFQKSSLIYVPILDAAAAVGATCFQVQ